MPTYEYRCEACTHNFDEFQTFAEKPLKKCPKCGKLRLRRVFGAGAAILFKGSGFYQTDYRSDSYKSAAKAEESSKTSANGSAGSDGAACANGTSSTTGSDGSDSRGASGATKSKAKRAKS